MLTIKPTETRTAMAEGVGTLPEGIRPWEDRTLSAKKRYESYKDALVAHVEGIEASMKRAGATAGERAAIRLNPETVHWVSELEKLVEETPKRFCNRIDVPVVLGKNFLGAAAWQQGFQVDVGAEPPLPSTITKALLESECPLHPGEKIKGTHLLVLMPKTVDGKPYTALKLDRLCATRNGSGDQLIYDAGDSATKWKSME